MLSGGATADSPRWSGAEDVGERGGTSPPARLPAAGPAPTPDGGGAGRALPASCSRTSRSPDSRHGDGGAMEPVRGRDRGQDGPRDTRGRSPRGSRTLGTASPGRTRATPRHLLRRPVPEPLAKILRASGRGPGEASATGRAVLPVPPGVVVLARLGAAPWSIRPAGGVVPADPRGAHPRPGEEHEPEPDHDDRAGSHQHGFHAACLAPTVAHDKCRSGRSGVRGAGRPGMR
jgi:hypothetical protein